MQILGQKKVEISTEVVLHAITAPLRVRLKIIINISSVKISMLDLIVAIIRSLE